MTQETSRLETLNQPNDHQLRGSIGSLNCEEGVRPLTASSRRVDQHFRRLFAALFNGGQARLGLIESDDPLEAGLEILAQPPKKQSSQPLSSVRWRAGADRQWR